MNPSDPQREPPNDKKPLLPTWGIVLLVIFLVGPLIFFGVCVAAITTMGG